MTCNHGLDETNCPTCRMMASSLPEGRFNLKNAHLNELKPQSTFLTINAEEKEQFISDLLPNNKVLQPISINPVLDPKLITQNPDLHNKLFQERLKELDITKSEVFKISKKVELESPEWKFDNSE